MAKITKACSVKVDKDATESYTVNVTVDYEGCTEDQVRDWATSHIIINVQRVLRTKSETELATLVKHGYSVKASDAGKGGSKDPLKAIKTSFGKLLTREAKLAAIASLEADLDLETEPTETDETETESVDE